MLLGHFRQGELFPPEGDEEALRLLWPTGPLLPCRTEYMGIRGAVPGGLAFLSPQEPRSPAQVSHLD